MERSMLGHLLCPGVPRYTSQFNPDGSNITTPNDMVTLTRHIYDKNFSKLDKETRAFSNAFLSLTRPAYISTRNMADRTIKAKIGVISDPDAGSDIHETGIIDDNLAVCIMLNKIGQQRIKTRRAKGSFFESSLELEMDRYFSPDAISLQSYSSRRYGITTDRVFSELMNVIEKYI